MLHQQHFILQLLRSCWETLIFYISLFQIHRTSLARRGGWLALFRQLPAFPVMRCGPLTLLLDTPRNHPIPYLLGVITSVHQLIALDFLLPLAVQLVSDHPEETGLLHLHAQPSPPHRHDWLTLLCLPDHQASLLLADHPGPAHQTGPAHLLVHLALGLLLAQPVLGLHTQAGITLLLIHPNLCLLGC